MDLFDKIYGKGSKKLRFGIFFLIFIKEIHDKNQ